MPLCLCEINIRGPLLPLQRFLLLPVVPPVAAWFPISLSALEDYVGALCWGSLTCHEASRSSLCGFLGPEPFPLCTIVRTVSETVLSRLLLPCLCPESGRISQVVCTQEGGINEVHG